MKEASRVPHRRSGFIQAPAEDRPIAVAGFAGLDEIPWPDLEHAYGSAEDVPVLLRILANTAPSPEAMGALDASIYHQGGCVYSAGAAAIPFLVALALSPGVAMRSSVVDILESFARLLGEIREPWRSQDTAISCRDSLRDAYESLSFLLHDSDIAVRSAIVDLLTVYDDRADQTVRMLRDHFDIETDLALRASILLATAALAQRGALSTAERDATAAWLDAVSPGPDDPLHLASLVAAWRIVPGSVSTDALVTAALNKNSGSDAHYRWVHRRGISGWIGDELGERREERTAWTRRVLQEPDPGLVSGVLGEAAQVMLRWRSSTDELVAPIADLLDHPNAELRARSAHLLAAAGERSRPFADHLAQGLDDPDSSTSLNALWALARLGDVRAVPLVARAVTGGPPTIELRSGHYSFPIFMFNQGGLTTHLTLLHAYAADLVPAIRRRLRQPMADADIYVLSEVISGYGINARDTLPELLDLLTSARAASVCGAIGALGTAADSASGRLAELFNAPDRDVASAAACAYFQVTGDPAQAVPIIGRALELRTASTVACQLAMLGPHAAIWATAVEALLLGNPGYWRHWQGAELAHAHWRMTGNPTLALTVFQQTLAPLRDLQSLPVMRSVLGYLAAIGPEARGLRPLLQSVVDTDQRLIGSGGWCGIAEDDDYRDLAAVAIRAM